MTFSEGVKLKIRNYVNSIFASNTWILRDDKGGVCLVDCGDVESIFSMLPQDTFVRAVFLTHTHYDHIYGLKNLLANFPDIPVYTSAYGDVALQSAKMNLSRYWGDAMELKIKNLRVVGNSDRVILTTHYQVDVIETPGHDESCLSYRIREYFFSGDSFIPGMETITSFPHSNKSDAERSRLKILSLADGCCLCPGHGKMYEHFRSFDYL